jgi:polysaccharide biosynthesis transport protein
LKALLDQDKNTMAYLPTNSDPNARSVAPRQQFSMQTGISSEWSVSTVRPPGQFLEYFNVIRANLLSICLLAMIGMAGGWLYATFKRPMFQAKTVLDIRSLNENFLNSREGGGTTGTTDSVLPESYIQTEIKILQSESLRKRAVLKISGAQKPFAQPKQEESLLASVAGFFKPTVAPLSELVADAGGRVKVRAVGNTRIVEVLCDAADGQLAANMCNTLANTYRESNLESRTQSTQETRDWLESQLTDVRNRLTKDENELKTVGKSTDFGLEAADAREGAAQEKLRVLQNALSRTAEERIVKESNYDVAASQKSAETLPIALDAGPIREYRMRIADLHRQLSEALVTKTPDHPQVRELKMQISEAERALENERNGLVSRLKADLETSLRQETSISKAYDQQAELVATRDDKAVRYSMIKRDVDSERRLYETLLQKVGEVGLATAMRTSTILIVDAATPPVKPYSPSMLASLGVGLFGGSVIGLAASFIRARSDRTLREPGEVAAHLQIRELGVFPSLRGRALRLLAKKDKVPLEPAAATLDLDPSTGKTLPPALQEPRTVLMRRMPVRSIALATWLRVPEMSEAVFGAMNSLLFAGKDGPEVRVIVMTSPASGDGKTTVATNLAIALAQIGRRVVLIDGDMRKPRLHTIFDKPADNGLSSLLENDDLKEKPIHEIVTPTQIANLFLIPTKPAHEGVSHKLHSVAMRHLLDRLRTEFDAVIIDSPPMLHISDARVLGWNADGVLLVFRARKTTIESALAVHDCLLRDGIRVLGSVLNDWDQKKNSVYGGYSSYFRVA